MFDIFHTVFRYKEKKSPDHLEFYPLRVHVSAMPERRYLWTSRVLVILATMSIALNMVLASTLYLLLPQVSVRPRLLRVDKDFSELVQVQPSEVRYSVTDLVTEQHITEYIYLRYIITRDYDELISRWAVGSKFYWYSTADVFRTFTLNDAKYNVLLFKSRGITRNVDIDWIRPLSRGFWQVQFRTRDYTSTARAPTINIWRATMRIGYVNIPFSKPEDAIVNPFGFMVANFSLAYRGTPETSTHYLDAAKQQTGDQYIR